MKATLIRYGAISGAVWLVLSFAAYLLAENGFFSDYSSAETIGYSSMVLSLSVIFFAVLRQRTLNGGTISFKQGYLLGLGISAIAGVVVGLWDILYVTVLNPDFYTEYSDFYKQQMIASGKTAEQIAKAEATMAAEMEMYTNPFFMFGLMFLTVLVIGAVISAVAAILLRRSQAQVVA